MAVINKISAAATADDQHTAHDSPDSESGLSVSRRVKIGAVLLLTMCGYLLMGESSQPQPVPSTPVTSTPGPESDIQEFVDDLEFVEESLPEDTAIAQTTEVSVQPASEPPLQLPGAAPSAGTHSHPGLSPNTQPPAYEENLQHHSQLTAATSGTALQSRQSSVYQRYAPLPQVRTVLRFTGRIEPMR